MYPLKAKTGSGGWLLLESRRKLIFTVLSLVLSMFFFVSSAQSQVLGSREKSTTDTVDVEILYASAYPGTDSVWLEVMMRNQVAVTGYHFIFNLGNPEIARFCQTGGSVLSIDSTGLMIPPSPNYQMLLWICLGACCIPDSATERTVQIYLSPDSYLMDTNGDPIPVRYHTSELMVWWSVPGDANSDSLVDVGDPVFITNYLYHEGPEPCVCEAADCNGDCLVSVSDIVYLINYLYKGGTTPSQGCVSCPNHYCWWWDKKKEK
jgi:hypothetical protein